VTPEHRSKMEAGRIEARSSEPPPHPAGVDRRPLEGFPPYYAIDYNKVVWTCHGHAGWPCLWRPLPIIMRGRHGTRACVQLRSPDGRQVFRSPAKLYRSAFLNPKLPASVIFPDWFDDEGDDEADGLPARVGGPSHPNERRVRGSAHKNSPRGPSALADGGIGVLWCG
jgi:hypothetical protein